MAKSGNSENIHPMVFRRSEFFCKTAVLVTTLAGFAGNPACSQADNPTLKDVNRANTSAATLTSAFAQAAPSSLASDMATSNLMPSNTAASSAASSTAALSTKPTTSLVSSAPPPISGSEALPNPTPTVSSAAPTGSAPAVSGTATTSGTPGYRVVGRVKDEAAGPRFAWPGVYFVARFSGTQVSARLKDPNNQNRFEVAIDGAPIKGGWFATKAGSELYSLASGLPNAEHEVVLWKNTETYKGTAQFLGFESFGDGGTLLPPPAAPERRIELIGDSITVGSGVEGTMASCNQDDFTNNYLAYGSIAARALKADVVTTAYSGIGVFHSCCDSSVKMPDRFGRTLADDSASSWDFAKYKPHVVVINLGTNDYSDGDPGPAYEKAYVDFVGSVQLKYPTANMLLLIQSDTVAPRVNSVLKSLMTKSSAPPAQVLDVSSVGNWDSCGHPTKESQQKMADLLVSKLKSMQGW